MRLLNLSRRTLGAVILVAGAIIGYLLWSLVIAEESYVPEEFVSANHQGVLIAGEIVELSRGTVESLEIINELDESGRYKEALELVEEEVKKNSQLKQKAYQLSEQLARMGEVLPEIEPRAAMEASLQALNHETLLIIRLLNYSGYLNDLFQVLEDKFNGEVSRPGQVAELVAKINSEAAAINRLNELYRESIERFNREAR